MIKQLTETELKQIAGGFTGANLHDLLVGERGPMRLTNGAGDTGSNETVSASTLPITDDILQGLRAGLTRDAGPELRGDLTASPFFRSGSAAFTGISSYQPSRRGRADTLSYRDADRSMERQARRPATLSWKTNYLGPR